MGLIVLALGKIYQAAGISHWQTMTFNALTLAQMAHVLAIRSERDSLFKIGILSNKALLGAVLLTFFLQIAVIYVPAFQRLFKTTDLTAWEFILTVLVSSVIFAAVEAEKFLKRRKEAAVSA